MRLFILFLVGLIIVDIGIQGTVGSLLAVFIDPTALQDVTA